MKPFFNYLRVSARILLLSAGLWIGACRENPGQAETMDIEGYPTVTRQGKLPDERIKKLQHEIEAGRQNINDIEAFVEMERAKLKENPDYDSSFLEEALVELQEIREAVEFGEKSLKELIPAGE